MLIESNVYVKEPFIYDRRPEFMVQINLSSTENHLLFTAFVMLMDSAILPNDIHFYLLFGEQWRQGCNHMSLRMKNGGFRGDHRQIDSPTSAR